MLQIAWLKLFRHYSKRWWWTLASRFFTKFAWRIHVTFQKITARWITSWGLIRQVSELNLFPKEFICILIGTFKQRLSIDGKDLIWFWEQVSTLPVFSHWRSVFLKTCKNLLCHLWDTSGWVKRIDVVHFNPITLTDIINLFKRGIFGAFMVHLYPFLSFSKHFRLRFWWIVIWGGSLCENNR